MECIELQPKTWTVIGGFDTKQSSIFPQTLTTTTATCILGKKIHTKANKPMASVTLFKTKCCIPVQTTILYSHHWLDQMYKLAPSFHDHVAPIFHNNVAPSFHNHVA